VSVFVIKKIILKYIFMKQLFIIYSLSFLLLFTAFSCSNSDHAQLSHIKNDLRPPAYPVIMIDPRINAWSMTDTLSRQSLKHSSGKEFPLMGAIRVDGEVFRFLGTVNLIPEMLAGISADNGWAGRYTFTEPAASWQNAGFDDSDWLRGDAAFGTPEEFNVHTLWTTSDIWVRREIQLSEEQIAGKNLILRYSHDDIFEVYINGKPVVKTGFEWYKNVEVPIPEEIATTIVDGKITVAAHCSNRYGGGLVDFGIYAKHQSVAFLEPEAVQKSVDVQASRTHYVFECNNIELKLSFTAPFLLDDLELTGRPVNYISCDVASLDEEEHQVEIYFEASPAWVSTQRTAATLSECYEKGKLTIARTCVVEPQLFDRDGAGWGTFYMAAEKKTATSAVGNQMELRKAFFENGCFQQQQESKNNTFTGVCLSLGKSKKSSGSVLLGYDDEYAVQYFGDNLRPYWNRKGNKTMEEVLNEANKDCRSLLEKCNRLDYEIMVQARKIGGKEYAELCALAYRQVVAGHKLVESPDKQLLLFAESMGTVDVFYPSSPLFLCYNPKLVKALMNPQFYYAESGKWMKPYPAHDVGAGKYPIANGQISGMDLPVEEGGNMLILTAAVVAAEGNAQYAEEHWEILSLWADYLLEIGVNTGDQKTTDTYAPAYAQNTNLSVKAITGIAAYGYLAKMLGHTDLEEKYLTQAREMAVEWEKQANAGDHYRMAFDLPNETWSQKYNLIWDKVLNLNIFPDSIAAKELSYYSKKQNKYGLPLDGRDQYSKADWTSWIAALATDRKTFREFIVPLHQFVNETTARVPMADFYNTDGPTIRGFSGRPVVGAFYMSYYQYIKRND
jgi:hypothetical protein